MSQTTNQPQEQQPNQPLIFAIHIIESPNEEDVFLGSHEEGTALEKCLHIMGVSSERYRVMSEDYLKKAVEAITAAHSPGGKYERHVPIVHLSCHGNEEGIGLTKCDGIVAWDRLRQILYPIQAVSRGWLILGVSACKGSNGLRMAWTIKKEDAPFALLVGPTHNVNWRDSLVGFITLYHRFTRTVPESRDELNQLIDTVNDATGLPRGTFMYHFGHEVHQDFRAFVMKWFADQHEKQKKEQAASQAASQALVAALRARATPSS